MDKLVIIPTYNEKENITAILSVVFSLEGGFHVLVIDDGSPDGTASIVQSLIQLYPERLFLEERTGKQGLGTAYIGRCNVRISTFLRWMPIFRIIRQTFSGCMMPAKHKVLM
jgi:glycosyltransferase involved in cell wall biosynthesis